MVDLSDPWSGLPDDVLQACKPLFDALPIDRAMSRLVPTEPVEEAKLVASIDLDPNLMAALWLYVDDLHASHRISQGLADRTGSFWHAIMHRREGDFSNSKYWYRNAAGHALLSKLGFDVAEFVDDVQLHGGVNPKELVERQRIEWVELFQWCALDGSGA